MVLDAAISADGPMVDNPSGQGCGRDFRSKLSETPGKPEKGTTMEAMGVSENKGYPIFRGPRNKDPTLQCTRIN